MSAVLHQAGAIPFRIEAEGLRVLLITSRDTGRWVIPKGGIEPGHTALQAAEQEAFEEAGIKGVMHKTPLGVYSYGKRLRSGAVQPASVEVYALEVTKQVKKWPERGQRRSVWVTIPTAMDLVDEPGMATLLLKLAQMQAASKQTIDSSANK
jgi:8-oxo-dGTP pyrophosphatase MutT (NUDIX family)